MNEIIKINEHDITAKYINGQKVVTFKDIDMVHERPDGTARRNFAKNREHFIEGVDFYVITPESLENKGMYEIRTSGIDNVNPRGTAHLTESGYLMLVKSFTDDLAWKVQRELVDGYFRVKKIVNEELSPQMQLLVQMVNTMAQKEIEDKERDKKIALAQETANKSAQAVDKIKEEITSPFEDWRNDVNKKVRQIAQNANIPYQNLFAQMYSDLESTGYDLKRRQENKRKRMIDSGRTKADVEKETCKLAIIEDDKKAKQLFSDIVSRYAVKYMR